MARLRSAVKPMPLRLDAGGRISSRMAGSMAAIASSWAAMAMTGKDVVDSVADQ